MSQENQDETLGFLREHEGSYVSVDLPQGYPTSIPPVLAATRPPGCSARPFHGHSARWTSKDVHERFGYLYSADELRDWVPRLRRLAEDAETTHVFMNSCYRDHAQVNAAKLAHLSAWRTRRGTADEDGG